VKQYDTGKSISSPLFYLEKVINDSEKARKVVEKLNDLAEIGDDAQTDKGWKTRYFSTDLTY
jgi:erythromycin esterase-like protein